MHSLAASIWLPMLVSGLLSVAPIAIRCLTLLIGLLKTLPDSVGLDRPQIFREFARAVSPGRTTAKSPPSINRFRCAGPAEEVDKHG